MENQGKSFSLFQFLNHLTKFLLIKYIYYFAIDPEKPIP